MKSITVFILKKLRFLTFVFFTKNLIFGWTPIKEGSKIIGMHRSSLWESPATYRLKGYGNDLDRWNSEKTSEHAIENRFGGSEYVEFDDNGMIISYREVKLIKDRFKPYYKTSITLFYDDGRHMFRVVWKCNADMNPFSIILDKIWIYEHFERNDRYQKNDFFPTEWYHKTDIDSGDIILYDGNKISAGTSANLLHTNMNEKFNKFILENKLSELENERLNKLTKTFRY